MCVLLSMDYDLTKAGNVISQTSSPHIQADFPLWINKLDPCIKTHISANECL